MSGKAKRLLAILPTAAASVALVASSTTLLVVLKLKSPASEPEKKTVEAAPGASSPSELLKRADAAQAAGDSRAAAALYDEAILGLSGDERLAAQIGLARARALLREGPRARALLRAALLVAGRPEGPRELVDLAEEALKQGEASDARRLFAGALALEARASDEKGRAALARAAAAIGETYTADEKPLAAHEAQAGAREMWLGWLQGVDANAAPTVAVTLSKNGEPRASVRAERCDARALIALVADRAGRKLFLPERVSSDAPAGATADFADMPLDAAVRVLANVAGLEIAPVSTMSETASDTIRLETLPEASGPEGRAAARRAAEGALVAALRWTGVDEARTRYQLGELARLSGRFEDAIGQYERLLAIAPKAPDAPQALLGLAKAESALLRFARSRNALWKLVGQRELAPQALLLIAESYLSEGRDGDAEKALKQLLASFADAKEAPLANLRLGRALAAQGDHANALAAFKAVASTDAALVAEAAVATARELLSLGRAEEAASTLAALLRKGGSDREAEGYLLLGRARHEEGRHLAALFALRLVVRRHAATPEGREAATLAAREETEVGLLRDATEALGHEAATAERSVELAKGWLAAGEPGRARAECERALAASSVPPVEVVLVLARCESELGDARACLRALERLRGRALSATERATAAGLAGRAELELGRFDRAVSAFKTGEVAPEEQTRAPSSARGQP